MLGSAGPAGQALSLQLGLSMSACPGDGTEACQHLVCWVVLLVEWQRRESWTQARLGKAWAASP